MPAISGFTGFADLKAERITGKIVRRVLSGDKVMMVWWSVKAGAHAAAHQHPHEQIFWVLKGTMEFRIGEERRTCGPGDLGVIPSGVEHEAWFPEDCEVIDLFGPPREDFLSGGTPPYMGDD